MLTVIGRAQPPEAAGRDGSERHRAARSAGESPGCRVRAATAVAASAREDHCALSGTREAV
ncbi:hypothetical protein AN218_03645 [Streptomyces nanshensis]|uniref:Uncharacterized protein n=1 Tax=Streptomyces nanshensis TaxID=518642 RepID=A0A1E7LB32_9ACTN|nr:hypothetical protein AN218_03645 [Streptomyces nanshensis]